ncbi:protein transport protein SEC31-like [Daphnia carinata]|uniref:protein transport protein SEC31-like n=1 Tax=Daphnia carinata TaxID=120202 RepID=UPI00257D0BA7|nr:protein transport protein SEC31-like [Daphnia carinata]
MSLGCRILILGLFLFESIWWVNGAAVPSFGNTQSQFPKDATDNARNASSPSDFKSFTPMEQMRPNSLPSQPPVRPFGTMPSMFQMLPQNALPSFVMMPQPPQTPQAGMVMMQHTPPPPSMMNNPSQQQGQPQQPKREIPPVMNATIASHAPILNTNNTRPNNNTRRETEPTTVAPATTVRQPAQETTLGTEQKESDGSKLKQASVNPFIIPQQPPQPIPMAPFNPMMQQFNPMMQPFGPMMNQPLFIDPMGRLMMLVPFDPSRLNLAAQAGPQGPQGPPLPIQIPFGQPQLRPVMPDFSKQPPRMPVASKNETTSS